MSRSRNNSRYNKASFFAYKQRRQHVNQTRAGLLEASIPAFTLTTQFKCETNSIIFWIIFFGLVRSAYGTVVVRDGVKVDAEITEQATQRLKRESSLTAAELATNRCNDLPIRVGALALTNSEFRENAKQVLAQPDFSLLCSNKKFMDSRGGNTIAFFYAPINALALAYDNLNDNTLSHEMIHASMHARHALNGNCYIKPFKSKSTVPVFPFNDENIKRFQDCMRLGQGRAYKLRQLRDMSAAGVILTHEQSEFLREGVRALAKSIPETSRRVTEREVMNDLKKSGWPDKKPVRFKLAEMTVDVIQVEPMDKMVRIIFKTVDPIDSLCESLAVFHRLTELNHYKDQESLLAEHLAYGLQCLDSEGKQFIYPELVQLMSEQKQQCTRKPGMQMSEL